MRLKSLTVATTAVLVSSGLVQAATYTFIPSASTTPVPTGTGNWNDGANWASGTTTGTVPSSSDTAGSATGGTTIVNSGVGTVNEVRFANAVPGTTVASPGGTPVVASSPKAEATLQIDAGGTLNIRSLNGTANGNFWLGRAQPSGGHLIINGGTLTTGTIESTSITNDSTANVIIGDISGQSGAAVGAANSTFDISSGTLTSANNLIVGNTFATVSGVQYVATGVANQTGGTVNVAGAVQIGVSGNGSYTISAGSLNQNGTNADGSALGRDAFFVGRNGNGTGNPGGSGTFVQSGTAAVSIANGLYIANNNNTTGSYTVSGGTLSISGEIKVGASTNSTGTTASTNNIGAFRIIGNDTPTITANRLTADTGNSTLGFTIDDANGTTLLNLVAGNSFGGQAILSTATLIDLDVAGGFVPAASDTFELLRAASISALPTLVLDGDAFDAATLSIRTNPNGTQSLIASVPEPTSLALAGGLAMVSSLRRRGLRAN